MNRFFRQLFFVSNGLVLQWFFWALMLIVGRFGIIKTLFLIYPIDTEECLDFSPDVPWLRRFFSGRPCPGGFIMEGWIPRGIYLLVPNPAMELVRKKNRPMVDQIIRRMLVFKKITGAKSIGLAGQLGPIFEKQLGTPMKPPFFISTLGNIFSIQSGVNHLTKDSGRKPWQVSVAVLGGGELAEQLVDALGDDGYRIETVDVRYTRKANVRLVNEQEADRCLKDVDFAINLLPRGRDFMDCQIGKRLPDSATVVDFSRPPISPETIVQKVVMGNRIQRRRMHFFIRLPGGWKNHEMPACSMPALLASMGSVQFSNIAEFRVAAQQLGFCSALAPLPATSRTKTSPAAVPAPNSAGYIDS